MIAAVEDFTALAVCPQCATMTIHPFRKADPAPHIPPRTDNEDPIVRTQRMIASMVETISLLAQIPSMYDPDGASVMRQCQCGYEWPQR